MDAVFSQVLDHSAIHAASGESADAGVPFEQQGLHVTCALYPDTNLTQKVSQLPSETMVLIQWVISAFTYIIIYIIAYGPHLLFIISILGFSCFGIIHLL